MAKQYTLFSFEYNDTTIDMKVNKKLYNHFQTKTPQEKEVIKQLMILGFKYKNN